MEPLTFEGSLGDLEELPVSRSPTGASATENFQDHDCRISAAARFP
jgi:hypothetical protein